MNNGPNKGDICNMAHKIAWRHQETYPENKQDRQKDWYNADHKMLRDHKRN